MDKPKILVTGSSGFIGHHFIKYLKQKGYWVRGADIKFPEFGHSAADDFKILDLREHTNCVCACEGIHEVYHFAADIGGIGYISTHHSQIFRNNALIDLNMLDASLKNKIEKFLFTSSACVYPQYLQKGTKIKPLKENDAYPADAEPGYGWSKLFTELACQYYMQDFGLKIYIARLHNIFGPFGSYQGEREKAPAALCRKIALAKQKDEVEVWGDGRQVRSFCYIDDCVEGLYRLMQSDYHKPINIGQDRMITINKLVDITAKVAEKRIKKRYDLTKPQGVRGRNADIALIKKILNWEPRVSLEKGLELTYKWISAQVAK